MLTQRVILRGKNAFKHQHCNGMLAEIIESANKAGWARVKLVDTGVILLWRDGVWDSATTIQVYFFASLINWTTTKQLLGYRFGIDRQCIEHIVLV